MNLINRNMQRRFCQKDEGAGAMKGAPPQPPEPLRTSAPDAVQPKAIQKTVLVVDDDALFLSMLGDSLVARGAKVLTAKNSTDALEIIRQEFAEGRPVDAVVADYVMPGADGVVLALSVRASFPSVNVMLVTSAPDRLALGLELAREDSDKKSLLENVTVLSKKGGFAAYGAKIAGLLGDAAAAASAPVVAAPTPTASAVVAGVPASEAKTEAPTGTRKQVAVLFVDDDEFNLNAYARCFRQDGDKFTLMRAQSVDEALKLLAEHPEIGLVVTDCLMPGRNGAELIAEIRVKYSTMKTMMVTGTPDEARQLLEQNNVSLAPDNILTKPFTPYDIRPAVFARLGIPL